MSLIYTKLTSIVNKISQLFHESLLFTIIFSILNYFENAWVNSYLKGLYPGENFLGFIKKNKILNSEAFNPLIVLVVFGAFLILSINAVSASLAITLAIAFIAFFIGSAILPRYFLNKEFKKPAIEFKSKDFYSIGFCLVLISILFFFVSVASVGGIPILKTSLRYQLKPLFTMPVFLIIPGVCILASAYLKKFQENKITRSQARFRFLILIGISCVFLLALGYRTPLLAVLLIMIIIGYYGNILAVWEVVVGALIGVCAVIFPDEGYVVDKSLLLVPIGGWVVSMLVVLLIASIYYKNLYYAYSNKRIIIRSGVFGVDFKSLDMSMIGAVNVYVSLIDKILRKNTGTILFGSTASPLNYGQTSGTCYKFTHIKMPYETCKEVKSYIDEYKKQLNGK